MRSITGPARSALSASRYYAGGLFKRLTTDPVFIWAQAIAFKVLVTLLPLVLLATGIFGRVLRQENPFEAVSGFIRSFLPPAQSGRVIELVFELQKASGVLTFVGGAAFVVAVVTMFATLRYIIGQAMGSSRHTMRSIAGGYLFDLRMIVQVGVLFLLSFGVTFAVNALQSQGGAFATQVGVDPVFVESVSGAAVRFVGLAVPYLLTFGMIVQLYHFIPQPHPPKRSAALGAAVAAVLFELAKNGFTLYATYIGDFDRYAQGDEGLGGLGGVFGLILALVFWVYLSGLILVIGAFVTRLHEHRMSPRRQAISKRLVKRLSRKKRHPAAAHPEAPTPTIAGLPEGDGLGTEAPPQPQPAEAPAEASPDDVPSDRA